MLRGQQERQMSERLRIDYCPTPNWPVAIRNQPKRYDRTTLDSVRHTVRFRRLLSAQANAHSAWIDFQRSQSSEQLIPTVVESWTASQPLESQFADRTKILKPNILNSQVALAFASGTRFWCS